MSAHQFGLTSATALIIGTIIGVGILNLPTSPATYGPISLVSVALTTVGALTLAWSYRITAWAGVGLAMDLGWKHVRSNRDRTEPPTTARPTADPPNFDPGGAAPSAP